MEGKISVCMPVYNAANTILQTIKSVLGQTFKDFELIIVDNASTDNTAEIIESVRDDRIRYFRNENNIGCGRNLQECKNKANGEIIFYICADDILDKDALKKVYDAFCLPEDIGIVTRPYYWFSEDVLRPVRVKMKRCFKENHLVSIYDSYDKIKDVIALSDQISGIGFRKKYMNFSFKYEPFIEMAGLVIPMLKNCKAVILKDNIVAVRTSYSGSINQGVYRKSPLMAWYDLINESFPEYRFKELKKYLINNFVANNYIGLVQIKNFTSCKYLLGEIYYLIKLKWQNIFNIKFWFFSIGTIIIPKFILRKLVVVYKYKINSRFLRKYPKLNQGDTNESSNTCRR